MLSVRVDRPAEDLVVIAVAGEIDSVTAPKLSTCLHRELEGQPAALILDLTAVSFLGVAGLRVLDCAPRPVKDPLGGPQHGLQRGVRRAVGAARGSHDRSIPDLPHRHPGAHVLGHDNRVNRSINATVPRQTTTNRSIRQPTLRAAIYPRATAQQPRHALVALQRPAGPSVEQLFTLRAPRQADRDAAIGSLVGNG